MAAAVAAMVGPVGRGGRRGSLQEWVTGREEGSFGWLRGYQCVSSLQNECPRFLRRGLYHVATIHAPPAAWLLAEGNARVYARDEVARGHARGGALTYLAVRK